MTGRARQAARTSAGALALACILVYSLGQAALTTAGDARPRASGASAGLPTPMPADACVAAGTTLNVVIRFYLAIARHQDRAAYGCLDAGQRRAVHHT